MVSRFWTRAIPKKVSGDEVAVRAIMTPYHFNKNGKKLHRRAFASPPEVDEVSVSRAPYVSLTIAKMYAKTFVERRSGNSKKFFMGLAFVDVSKVRQNSSDVVDSRGEYLGHGDIVHGIVVPKGEPLPPELQLALDKKLDGILKAAQYLPDPNPRSAVWK